MKKSTQPKIAKFPAAKQRCLDELLDKNSEGKINSQERLVLKRLVAEAERLTAANAKRLTALSHKNRTHARQWQIRAGLIG